MLQQRALYKFFKQNYKQNHLNRIVHKGQNSRDSNVMSMNNYYKYTKIYTHSSNINL